MKLKKILHASLLFIPLYFFAAPPANADEFKINLNDPTVKIEDGKTKKGNIVNDLNLTEFGKRAYDRLDKKIKEEYWAFTVSQELADFIQDPERATFGMNDNQRKAYMDKVNDELETVIIKEVRKQLQGEFKESEFYKDFKEKVKYYREKIKGNLKKKIEVIEKELYIDEGGGINFNYKKQKYKYKEQKLGMEESAMGADASIVIEEKHIETLPGSEKSTFHFRRYRIGVLIKQDDSFEFKLKTDPFRFHSWDYNPRVDLYLTTKYGSAHARVEYKFKKQKLKASLSSTLPKGYTFSIDYNHDIKDKTDVTSATLQKNIKGWDVSLSCTDTRVTNIDKTHSKSQAVWLRFEYRF